MRVVKRSLKWILSWLYATISVRITRPTLEESVDDPLIGYVREVHWQIHPFKWHTDYYALHDLDLVESWEPSDTLH